MSVARCQQEVDSREFTNWLARQQKKPIGTAQEDFRFGVLYTVLCSLVQAWSTKKLTLPKMLEIFPSQRTASEAKVQTPQQIMMAARAWTIAMGGKIVKKGERRGRHRATKRKDHRGPNRGRA